MKLNTENVRKFNTSLKKELSIYTNQKIKVEIINSYKFPDCYVRVHSENGFNNDFKLLCFDLFGNDRKGLLNTLDVSYGNIQSKNISGKVNQWVNLCNNI